MPPVILRLPTGLQWVATSVVLLGAALAVAACNGDDGAGGGETPTTDETPTDGGATAVIKMIPGIAFDKAELTIAADVDVVVTADNTADGVRHSFSVYTDESAIENLGMTEICTGPCVDTVTLNLATGPYFFRCEVHPTIMTGTLIAGSP